MSVKPNNKAALAFLKRWSPPGPWVLTAIKTDRKAINTRTFWARDEEAVLGWLQEYNGKRNIYFHVNPPIKDITKKADREDIKSLDWLHVDIDPRAGEDLEEERARALALLTTRLPEGVPPPSCIIFSGGGYQGFWRLTEPQVIDGNLEIAEDLKRYNQQLEVLFGADNCHNIDRIMRLPGTINLPDARKAKKGRVPTLAETIDFNDLAYSISVFKKAPEVQIAGETGFGGKPVKVPGNIDRIEDHTELDKYGVPDRLKVIMAQGRHPDEKKEGDNSRSAWLFDFLCNMVRCGVPDDVLFSIVTDPEWGISESVLELKGNAEKYALRQIARAREWSVDPELVKMNDKYAVIKHFGGKCLVVTEVYDYAMERHRLMKMTFGALKDAYLKDKIKVGEDKNGNPIEKRKGIWWLENRNRREFETIVFAPEKQVPPDVYNLWKGFDVQAIPGDCSLFLDHVRRNVCGGNEEHYQYLMGWMARCAQYPGSAGEVAIVLRGGRGVGKSFFAKVFGSLFGRHFMQVSNSSHLVGNFNSHLRDLVVLFADEAFYAGDKKHESILKTLVTEEFMAIEAKGVDVEPAPNYIHLIMASNDMHVIPAGGDERRFFVLDVGKEHQQDGEYFGAIVQQMKSGGREALLHILRTWDLSDFKVWRVPQTKALREQKLLSLGVEEEWWYQKLLDGDILDGEGWPVEVISEQLTDDYITYTRRINILRRANQVALGRFLHKVCPRIAHTRRLAEIEVPMGDGWMRKKSKRCKFFVLPTLAECRARWEELHGAEEWEEIEQQHDLPLTSSGEPPF